MNNQVNCNSSECDSDYDPNTQGMHDEIGFCYTTDTDKVFLYDSDIDTSIVGDACVDNSYEDKLWGYDSDVDNSVKKKKKKVNGGDNKKNAIPVKKE